MDKKRAMETGLYSGLLGLYEYTPGNQYGNPKRARKGDYMGFHVSLGGVFVNVRVTKGPVRVDMGVPFVA